MFVYCYIFTDKIKKPMKQNVCRFIFSQVKMPAIWGLYFQFEKNVEKKTLWWMFVGLHFHGIQRILYTKMFAGLYFHNTVKPEMFASLFIHNDEPEMFAGLYFHC